MRLFGAGAKLTNFGNSNIKYEMFYGIRLRPSPQHLAPQDSDCSLGLSRTAAALGAAHHLRVGSFASFRKYERPTLCSGCGPK